MAKFSIIIILRGWKHETFCLISVTDIWSTFFSFFSSLIGFSSQNLRLDRSITFTTWSAFCIIVMTFYTGMMKSTIILPKEVGAIRKITDLLNQNYSLVYPSHIWKDNYEMLAKERNYSDLVVLIETAEVRKDYIKDLAFADRKSNVYFWTVAFNAVALVNELVTNSNIKTEKRRAFSAGTELLPTGESFIAFLLPNTGRMFRVVRRLVDAGIHQRWRKEYLGLSLFMRVQDQVKFISKTKILYDGNRDDKLLTISGEIVNILALFGICVGIDLFVFVYEKLIF